MLRVFYSDLRFALCSRGFKTCCIITAAYTTFTSLLLQTVSYFFYHESITGDDVLNCYSDMAIFIITAATLFVFTTDFADGTIRNKLISGATRSDILISALLNGGIIGASQAAIFMAVQAVLTLIMTDGYYLKSISEAARTGLIFTAASAAVGIFSTMLIMVLSGKRTVISYVAGLVIAFLFRIVSLEVSDKLYPESGFTALTGTRLAVYRFYDRYVPYAHFTSITRWDFASYIIGALALALISFVIGLILFNQKEFN